MIEFFTETLSGSTYFITVVVCIILILALIGVMSEVKYMKTIEEPSINENNINEDLTKQNNVVTSTNDSKPSSVTSINNSNTLQK